MTPLNQSCIVIFMNETGWFVVLGVVIFVLLSFFVILPWRFRRAIPKVIRTFRELNATNSKTARTLDELGIKIPSLFSTRLFKDFKKESLDILIQAGVVVWTEDDRYYLVEDKLISSNLYRFS